MSQSPYKCIHSLLQSLESLFQKNQEQSNSDTVVSPATPVQTWNGAPSFQTTEDARLDLFFSGMVRSCPSEKLISLLTKSWAQSPEDTIKLILHGRDIRTGKGEKEVALQSLLWLRKQKPLTYLFNLHSFLAVGCYKDLLKTVSTYLNTNSEPDLLNHVELQVFAEDLEKDCKTLQSNSESPEKVTLSLASKWAPSERYHFDKKYQFAGKLAELLFPEQKDARKQYRLMLTRLRKHLNLVESQMCAGLWDQINFSHVPSRAHTLFKYSFAKHQKDRYIEYLQSVKSNRSKINSSGVHPHEIVQQLKTGPNETLELLWETIVKKIRDIGSLSRALAIVDVSGSMTSPFSGSQSCPLDVSLALGLLISELNTTEIYHNTILTFSSEPKFHKIVGNSLYEKIQNLQKADWEMSTNLEKALLLILNTAQEHKLSHEEMPESLYILSDMQFDTCADGKTTNLQNTRDMYAVHGFVLPKIIFWNLSGKIEDYPATKNDNDVLLLSGFSPCFFAQVTEGKSVLEFLMNEMSKYDGFQIRIADCERHE